MLGAIMAWYDIFKEVPVVGSIIEAGAGLLGGALGSDAMEKANKKNLNFQKDLATHGIRYRVEDAKAAGLHPLVGAGVMPHLGSAGSAPNTAFPDALGKAGSDIGRAIARSKTEDERQQAKLNRFKTEAEIKNIETHSRLLESQINERTQEQPPFPGAVKNSSGFWEGELGPDYKRFIDNMGKKGVKLESSLTFDNMTGIVKYYPSQEIMDLISESTTAAAGYYYGIGKYKYIMMHGKANPRTKDGIMYQNEKRRVSQMVGSPVELTTGGRWRIKNWRNR